MVTGRYVVTGQPVHGSQLTTGRKTLAATGWTTMR